MKNQLFIPKKCKVGFNLRKDTYTGKLGYIIYHDGKVWRKEGSWESWREKYITPAEYNELKKNSFESAVTNAIKHHEHAVIDFEKNPNSWYATDAKKTLQKYLEDRGLNNFDKYQFHSGKATSDEGIIPLEFDNLPTEGFVLNKKAGGYSTGWDARQTYCRVWDPRGFEFEITIPNLLFILQETNSLKGKGLEGTFVYSWDGKDLVLIPTSCQEYKSSSSFTELQGGKVAAKDLVAGYTYKTKKEGDLIYLGKFENFEKYYGSVKFGKRFIFVDNKGDFIAQDSVANLSRVVSEIVTPDFAELVDKYSKSDYVALPRV